MTDFDLRLSAHEDFTRQETVLTARVSVPDRWLVDYGETALGLELERRLRTMVDQFFEQRGERPVLARHQSYVDDSVMARFEAQHQGQPIQRQRYQQSIYEHMANALSQPQSVSVLGRWLEPSARVPAPVPVRSTHSLWAG